MKRLLTIEIRCGEYEFISHSKHPKDADVEDYLKNFYSGEADESDGGVYFNGGEVFCKIVGNRLITEAQAKVLRETGVAF